MLEKDSLKSEGVFGFKCRSVYKGLKEEVTISTKNDYCDSIDIAGSTIAILLLLWTTIEILL